MPADVAVRPAAPVGCFRAPGDVTSGSEASAGVASGRLTLLTPDGRRQAVLVTVHRTSLEHFAVLYPAAHHSRAVCGARPLGVLNLRNTRAEPLSDDALSPGTSGFVVRQRAPDAPNALTFLCEEGQRGESWLVAFTWRGSPNSLHACSLPAVAEDDEF